MANYQLQVSDGAKGKGLPHANYIARVGEYTKKADELAWVESGNMPKWAAHNPSRFWQAADDFERANGKSYREIQVSLPRELESDQHVELVRDFVQKGIGGRHAYTWAIHNAIGIDGDPHPHAHIMFSKRLLDGIERDPKQYFKRYNAKKPELGGHRKNALSKLDASQQLIATRERWANIQKTHLEQYGHADRVDHRSYAARGLNIVPEQKLGWQNRNNPEAVAQLKQARADSLSHRQNELALNRIDWRGLYANAQILLFARFKSSDQASSDAMEKFKRNLDMKLAVQKQMDTSPKPFAEKLTVQPEPSPVTINNPPDQSKGIDR